MKGASLKFDTAEIEKILKEGVASGEIPGVAAAFSKALMAQEILQPARQCGPIASSGSHLLPKRSPALVRCSSMLKR
jgi:hypothetical protein